MSERTILFVCLHGAAKSVIAASHCQRLANDAGLTIRATFAGTEPDDEIAPAAATGLLAEGIDVRDQPTHRVTPEELRHAWRVVSFGCDLEALAPGVRVERWDDVPAVSENYRAARDAIVARLPRLVEASAGRARRPPPALSPRGT
jgi:arsenate reductase (thioredoxin)